MPQSEFKRIFAAHADFAWRSLSRLGVAEADLQDACQEVFLTVHRKLPQFEGKSTLRTWIYGICRGIAANQRRRAYHRHEIISDDPYQSTSSPDHHNGYHWVKNREYTNLLHALLDRLDPMQREVFILYEIEEWTLQEVADSTSCSRGTVFARLQAARGKLATQLRRLQSKRSVA